MPQNIWINKHTNKRRRRKREKDKYNKTWTSLDLINNKALGDKTMKRHFLIVRRLFLFTSPLLFIHIENTNYMYLLYSFMYLLSIFIFVNVCCPHRLLDLFSPVFSSFSPWWTKFTCYFVWSSWCQSNMLSAFLFCCCLPHIPVVYLS